MGWHIAAQDLAMGMAIDRYTQQGSSRTEAADLR